MSSTSSTKVSQDSNSANENSQNDLFDALQEDDEFEEFSSSVTDGPTQSLPFQHWEDDWDADDIDTNFVQQLSDAIQPVAEAK